MTKLIATLRMSGSKKNYTEINLDSNKCVSSKRLMRKPKESKKKKRDK